jgi:hypothetical protein
MKFIDQVSQFSSPHYFDLRLLCDSFGVVIAWIEIKICKLEKSQSIVIIFRLIFFKIGSWVIISNII